MPDARVNAWLAAWKILGGITVAQQKNALVYEQVELQMEQARIFTDLARAAQDVGVTAGDVLTGEQDRREENKKLAQKIFDRERAQKEPVAEDWIGKATTAEVKSDA